MTGAAKVDAGAPDGNCHVVRLQITGFHGGEPHRVGRSHRTEEGNARRHCLQQTDNDH